jgi:hypothetical protein
MSAGGLAAVLMAFAGTSPLLAHHSVLGFDSSREVAVEGRVVEVVWRYPHVYLAVDVGEAPEQWLVEVEAPAVLVRLGWNERTVTAGDRIRASGAPSRDGSRRMRCDSVETSGGRRLPCYPGGRSVHSK